MQPGHTSPTSTLTCQRERSPLTLQVTCCLTQDTHAVCAGSSAAHASRYQPCCRRTSPPWSRTHWIRALVSPPPCSSPADLCVPACGVSSATPHQMLLCIAFFVDVDDLARRDMVGGAAYMLTAGSSVVHTEVCCIVRISSKMISTTGNFRSLHCTCNGVGAADAGEACRNQTDACAPAEILQHSAQCSYDSC
jgi:hypothetical protein